MGIGPFRVSSSDSIQSPTTITDPNPNPFNFSVRDICKIKKKGKRPIFVSRVHYPNCNNYEGNKILVTEFDPRKTNKLDPHFSLGSGLIARFAPTQDGWNMAIEFAKNIAPNYQKPRSQLEDY